MPVPFGYLVNRKFHRQGQWHTSQKLNSDRPLASESTSRTDAKSTTDATGGMPARIEQTSTSATIFHACPRAISATQTLECVLHREECRSRKIRYIEPSHTPRRTYRNASTRLLSEQAKPMPPRKIYTPGPSRGCFRDRGGVLRQAAIICDGTRDISRPPPRTIATACLRRASLITGRQSPPVILSASLRFPGQRITCLACVIP